MQDAGYHGASNTKDNANSLTSLTEAFSSLQSHRTQQDMALQTLLQEAASLHAVISQNQASNTQQQYQVPANIQFPPPPPVQQYAPPPPPPMINHMPAMPMPPAPPTPTQQQYYALPQQQAYNNYNGGCHRCNGGRGHGGRNNAVQQNNPPHPIKRYNNWWYCY